MFTGDHHVIVYCASVRCGPSCSPTKALQWKMPVLVQWATYLRGHSWIVSNQLCLCSHHITLTPYNEDAAVTALRLYHTAASTDVMLQEPNAEALATAQQHVLDALRLIKLKIQALQSVQGIPNGLPNGLVPKYFLDYTIDSEEGVTYSIDRAWTRVFQKCSNRLDLIT